jgi:hypothetical protein
VIAAAAAFAGCRAPTQITLEPGTDVVCSEIAGTIVTTGRAQEIVC